MDALEMVALVTGAFLTIMRARLDDARFSVLVSHTLSSCVVFVSLRRTCVRKKKDPN